MEKAQSSLEALIAETRQRPVSRITFIQRVLALGFSATAAAGILATLEGAGSAHAAASPTEVTFSSWGSLDEQVTITTVLKAFQKMHPEITVSPLLASWGSYWPKYNADLAAKATADVQFLTFVPKYAAAGALLELRSLLKKHGKTIPATYTPGLLGGFEYNGGVYGLPRDNDTKVIFYNKALFRKAGLALPTDSWTWDDLRKAAMKLTVRRGNRVSQYGFAYETDWWWLYIWQNGVNFFDNDAKPTKVTFNTPAAAQALQFMADLTNVDKVTPAASQLGDSSAIAPLFASGQLGMAFGNHALVPTFVKTPGLDWGVVGLPHFAGQKTVNVAGGAGYSIAKWTKVPDAAYTLWSYLVGPVAASTFSSGNDIVPLNPETLHSAAWNSKPYNKVFTKQTELGHPLPTFANWWPTDSKMEPIIQKVFIGELTAKAGLAQAAAVAAQGIKG